MAKKAVHKNEGITVSFTPKGNHMHELVVSGKNIPADATYRIANKAGEEIMAGPLLYGVTESHITNTSHEFNLIVKVLNKQVSYGFSD